ncbi:hypothetical protein SUS17_3957 [Sphingomonas sp. S17]|nr:hypothetical protein SUS17_3957 [Sphingomonas sp. S17]
MSARAIAEKRAKRKGSADFAPRKGKRRVKRLVAHLVPPL